MSSSGSDVAAGAGDATLDAAVQMHRAGKVERAAKAYREILQRDPQNPNALHLLGVTELQAGHFEEAVDLISGAVAVQPNTGVYHVNLAAALRSLRRIDEAIAEAEKAIVLDANLAAQGYHIAALAFVDAGQPQDAIDCWVKALEAKPEFAEAHLSIASLMDSMGKYFFAVTQQEYAENRSREWVQREPDSAQAHLLLGRSLEQGGKLDEAVAEYRAATRLLPHDATVFLALGKALHRQGQYDEAMTSLRFAARMNPKLADAHAAVGALLLSQSRPAEAAESFRAALALLPDHPEARAKLADALAQSGEIEQAVAEARAAVAAAPTSPAARSAFLRTLLLDPRVSADELLREHAEWDRQHGVAMRFAHDEHAKWERRIAPQLDEQNRPRPIDKTCDRPLRIGFVSPHFRRHPVAKMIIPLLEQIDRRQFAIFCYSDVITGDEVTDSVKRLSTVFRETSRFTDTQLALLIREDHVDVLVDLAGHGEGNRMPSFAQKPAPVQVTQMGYPFTTGLSAIDYRVSDEVMDPVATDHDSAHVETLVRLPRPSFCFRPWEPTPPRIEARPASQPITFGCVSDASRMSSAIVETWAKLMSAVPDSRLLVMSSTRDEEPLRARLVRLGIPQFRLTVVSAHEGTRYLDLFNTLDIVLDTFPFSGGTTAGDAAWMGRPTITLSGPLPPSRVAAVFLRSMGLNDLIASSHERFVEVAAKLANDRPRLEQLSLTLRERLAKAPICYSPDCAAAVMRFYRDAWRRFCESPEPQQP